MFCTDLQCNFFSSGRLTNYRKSWLTVNQFWIQRGRWKFKMLKDNKMLSCTELAEQVLRFRDHAYFELIIRETLAWCFIFNLRVLGSLKHQETDWKPKKFSWTDICRRKSGIIPILHKKGKWVFALILGRVTLKNHCWQKELPDCFCNSDTEYLHSSLNWRYLTLMRSSFCKLMLYIKTCSWIPKLWNCSYFRHLIDECLQPSDICQA